MKVTGFAFTSEIKILVALDRFVNGDTVVQTLTIPKDKLISLEYEAKAGLTKLTLWAQSEDVKSEGVKYQEVLGWPVT